MNFNPLTASFWALGIWQGISVLVSVVGLIVSPLLSMLYERLLGKKENQEHINAYKAIILPDGSLSLGELFFFLFAQSAASYCLFLFFRRVIVLKQIDPNTLLVLSFVGVFLLTWIMCAARRKSLAKLLTWHLCLVMLLFCLILIGLAWHKGGNAYIVRDFSFIKHQIGQYLPADLKQSPPIAWLKNVSLTTIPVDMKLASPPQARVLFIQLYCSTLAVLLFFYALHKRHRANRLTAFIHLSEKQRKEQLDAVDYQSKLATLELQALSKQEKKDELDLKNEQKGFVLQREELALQKERLSVESTQLDVEKKRADYTLDLAIRLIDTLYGSGGGPEERAETLRQTLPAFQDFGSPGANSTAVVLRVLQETHAQAKAIPVTIV